MEFKNIIPELVVLNLEKSLEFYIDTLGFKIEYTRKQFAFISYFGAQIILSENQDWNTAKLERPFGRGINFEIKTEDVNLLIKRLKKINYPLFRNIEESWYRKDEILLGQREFLVQDPDGYLLRFAQSIGEKPA